MFLFYTPINANGLLSLTEDERRHATKTLRKRVGDEIWSTDGSGHKYKSRISELSKSEVVLEIISKEEIFKSSPNLHIAIALTKNAGRIEWFLEKATEIGISQITPLVTARTEKKSFKKSRADKIIISAMKQSLRCYLPQLQDATTLQDFLSKESNSVDHKYVGHYKEDNLQLQEALIGGNNSTILIGPEGDFTEEEMKLVEDAGFISINLGNHRLRTETAGIVACHTFNLINNG